MALNPAWSEQKRRMPTASSEMPVRRCANKAEFGGAAQGAMERESGRARWLQASGRMPRRGIGRSTDLSPPSLALAL
eukprot:1673999-Pleurochrysis_carterae.AAC.1